MELRDDVNAATGPADAAIARESAHATHEPGHATHTHVSRVSGHGSSYMADSNCKQRRIRRQESSKFLHVGVPLGGRSTFLAKVLGYPFAYPFGGTGTELLVKYLVEKVDF